MDLNYFVHASSIVDEGATIGSGTNIWHFSHVCAGAKIGKNCSFGQNTYIAPGVEIGDSVRVQNGVSLYTGLTIEDYCFVGPNAVFTNDRYPRACGQWELEPTVLRRGASIGANATILCGVELGEFCMVGCGSVVTATVAPYSLVAGNPARLQRMFSIDEIKQKFTFLSL